MRTGLIAKKEGMTRTFRADGRQVPVTVLRIENCQVVAQRTLEKDGYTALQLGAGEAKLSRTAKAQRGHFAKAGIAPKKKLAEFRVSPENMVDVGATFSPAHFVEGQIVDVVGTTKGRGFAGAIKRWNFGGLRATHGVSVSHRSHGSTGQRQDPGKVFKNKKMAGHYGVERVTTQNLKIVQVRAEEGLLLIEGCVPGPNNGWVLISDGVKAELPADAPKPAGLMQAAAAAAASAAPSSADAEAQTSPGAENTDAPVAEETKNDQGEQS